VCRTYGASLEASEATAFSISTTKCSESSTSSTQTFFFSPSPPTTSLSIILAPMTQGSGVTESRKSRITDAPMSSVTNMPTAASAISKLEGGQVAGIVIGAVVGLVDVAAGWFLVRKRQSKRAVHQAAVDTQHEAIPQLDSWQIPYQDGKRIQQLEGTPVHEIGEVERVLK
jgi:hypothetical protein